MAKAKKPAAAVEIRRVQIADLRGDPDNPREHPQKNIDLIRASLAEFAQVQPVVVQKDGVTVIGGHGTLEAMRLEGWTECDVAVTSFDGAKAKKLGLALNRAGEFARWNPEKLAAEVERIDAAGLDLDALALDSLLPEDSDEEPEIKEWSAEDIATQALFTFRAPLELQAKIRAVLVREFPGVHFDEEVIHE